MRLISFGYTWPAFVAREKSCTRRDWKANYAHAWQAGEEFAAYDVSPRFGGQQIGVGRLVAAPYLEPLANMPDCDYAAEGFKWLTQCTYLLGPTAKKQVWYPADLAGFERWRTSGGRLYVIRFEIVSVEASARRRLDELMEQHRERLASATRGVNV